MNRRSFVGRIVGGMAAVLVPFAPRRKGQEESEQVEVATPTWREVTISDLDGESRRGMMIWDAQRNVWQIVQIEWPYRTAEDAEDAEGNER